MRGRANVYFYSLEAAIIKGGAINFNATSNISFSASTDWAVGTGDFTVEWFQYQTNNGSENFIFDLGTSDNFAVSIKAGGSNLYVYENGSRTFSPSITNSLNVWHYVAISRVSGTLNLYFDGTRVSTGLDSSNITDSSSTFYVGCENPASPTNDNWPGYITNFRFIKGAGLYSAATISIPNRPLTNVANTKLLLKAVSQTTFLNDSSSQNKTATNNGAAFINVTPF